VESIYEDGVGEAKISSCGPGAAMNCQFTANPATIFENMNNSDVKIGTISGYSGTPDVKVAPDDVDDGNAAIGSITNVRVVDGNLRADITTNNITTSEVVVNLKVTADPASQDGSACDGTTSVTVKSTAGFWQVKDANVTTTGSLISLLPSAKVFNENGLGGFPGVSVFADTFDLGEAGNEAISENDNTDWNANTSISSSYAYYNYTYFRNLVPSDVEDNPLAKIENDSISGDYFQSGGVNAEGYAWYIADGALTLRDASLSMPSGRKVILFVNGDFTINQDINLPADGKTFFMAIVNGNTNIDPSVTNLDGIYFANGGINTGTKPIKDTDSKLNVRGSVVAIDGLSLDRNLPNNLDATPAEYFEYDPALFMLIPYRFGNRIMNWKEVPPSKISS
jgi:hypothetical protein